MSGRAVVVALLVLWPLQPLDDAAQRWIQHLRRPGLEAPMNAATNLGRPLLLGVAVVALAGGVTGRALLGETALVLAPVNVLVEGLKLAVDRRRPEGDRRRSNSSFPSSHAANAFAVATVLARRWRRGAVPFFMLAGFVALSRIYLNRHWTSDVLFGAIIGVGIAWAVLAWRARRRERRSRAAPA